MGVHAEYPAIDDATLDLDRSLLLPPLTAKMMCKIEDRY